MAFDFGPTDCSDIRPFGIGLREFELLGEFARAKRNPLLARLSDYYGDVAFSPGELSALRTEVLRLTADPTSLSEFEVVASGLAGMIDLAMNRGVGIEGHGD